MGSQEDQRRRAPADDGKTVCCLGFGVEELGPQWVNLWAGAFVVGRQEYKSRCN